MKRIALISVLAAAAAFAVVKPTSAETTVPMEDLALVNETTTTTATPLAEGIEPVQAPGFQFGRFQFGRFHNSRFQFGRF